MPWRTGLRLPAGVAASCGACARRREALRRRDRLRAQWWGVPLVALLGAGWGAAIGVALGQPQVHAVLVGLGMAVWLVVPFTGDVRCSRCSGRCPVCQRAAARPPGPSRALTAIGAIGGGLMGGGAAVLFLFVDSLMSVWLTPTPLLLRGGIVLLLVGAGLATGLVWAAQVTGARNRIRRARRGPEVCEDCRPAVTSGL